MPRWSSTVNTEEVKVSPDIKDTGQQLYIFPRSSALLKLKASFKL